MLNPSNKYGTKIAYTELRKFLIKYSYLLLQPEVFYACRKYKEKLHKASKQNQRVFTQNRNCKNVNLNRKSIFFLCFESRRSRLTRVPCWCERFSYAIKMCSYKTTFRFREVIHQKNKTLDNGNCVCQKR